MQVRFDDVTETEASLYGTHVGKRWVAPLSGCFFLGRDIMEHCDCAKSTWLSCDFPFAEAYTDQTWSEKKVVQTQLVHILEPHLQ